MSADLRLRHDASVARTVLGVELDRSMDAHWAVKLTDADRIARIYTANR